MFKSISWQEFLTVIGCLAAGYYVVAIAIFYSRDILLKLKGAPATKTAPENSNAVSGRDKFMGAISSSVRKKIPTKQSVEALDEVIIQSEPEDLKSEMRASSPALELLDDLEEVFMILAAKKAEREQYLRKINNLFKLKPEFSEASIRPHIVEFIIEYFKGNQHITFTSAEIEKLWVNEKEEVIHQSTKNNYEK